MNIFYLDSDPKVCASMHNDKHCVKMILEYAQLLSTAHRVLDGNPVKSKTKTGRNVVRYSLNESDLESTLYHATHINHPSAVWVRQSYKNYVWLYRLLVDLCKEYTFRYGKIHKVESSQLLEKLYLPPNKIARTSFTEPTPAMPDDVKIIGDSIASYRNYYINNKQHLAKWKNRSVPNWFVEKN
jgi:hypothetical protein